MMHFTTSGGNHVIVATFKQREIPIIILVTELTGFPMKGLSLQRAMNQKRYSVAIIIYITIYIKIDIKLQ